MSSFAVSAIGRDRPGIVAAVARALFEQGCNVEDSSMTLLRGNFAIMLVLSAGSGTTASSLEGALREACDPFGLMLSVQHVDDTPSHAHPSHMLTVYGADKPGILLAVTMALAERDVNITDLNSRLVGGATPVYALMLELALPDGLGETDLAAALDALAADVGVDLSLRPMESDIL